MTRTRSGYNGCHAPGRPLRRLLLAAGLLALCACQTLPPRDGYEPERAFDRPGETELGSRVQEAAAAHAGQSGFLILDSGRQALLQRATLIEAAQRSIDAQYYIWNSDATGRYLAQRLLLAAERGVQVRLLLDDINLAGRDAVVATLDRHPNIDIRVYNPFVTRAGAGRWLGFVTDFERLNRRMHNKTFVVDGSCGIVGGRNIGDEYFDRHAEVNFRDRDVLAAGPIVRDVSANFDAYWNSSRSYPIALLADDLEQDPDWGALYQQVRSATAAADFAATLPQAAETAHAALRKTLAELTWANAELIFDPVTDAGDATDGDTPKLTARRLGEMAAAAETEILVESAYFILGEEQLAALAPVLTRGVTFRALTNSLASNDLTTNHAGYARWRAAMLTAGLQLHELRPDAAACATWIETPAYCGTGLVSLHAKSAVFDRKALYVGSFNVNLRSTYLNAETVLIIHSAQLAERVARDIELGMEKTNSWSVTRDGDGDLLWTADQGGTWSHEPTTGTWRRAKSRFFSWLPIEKYL